MPEIDHTYQEDQLSSKADFSDKLEPIVIHPLDPMAGKQTIEFDSYDLYQSFFSVLNDPIRLEILKLLAFEDKSFKLIQDELGLSKIDLLAHIKELVQKHYIRSRTNGHFTLTDGGLIITRLLNKVAKYLDPKIHINDDDEIIFPFRYHLRW